MKWMRERDLLIAQTMEFVQSVTGKKPDIDRFVAASEAESRAIAGAPMTNIEAVLIPAAAIAEPPKIEAVLIPAAAIAEPPKSAKLVQMARPDFPDDFQSEIKARIANFRAHQERFLKEREAYCSATMAKVRTALGEAEPPRLGK
jgi:hypothetical protein